MRSVVTDRESGDAPGVIDQDGVAKSLSTNRPDFIGQIEARIKLVSKVPACRQRLGRLRLRQATVTRPPRRRASGRHRGGHDRGQEARIKSKLLVQGDVLCAVRERKQAGLRRSPGVELRQRTGQQSFCDTMLVKIRTHRDRPEKSDAAPSRRKVRADEPPVAPRTKRRDIWRAPSAVNIVAVAPEGLGLWHPDEGTECDAQNFFRFGKILLVKRSNDNPPDGDGCSAGGVMRHGNFFLGFAQAEKTVRRTRPAPLRAGDRIGRSLCAARA